MNNGAIITVTINKNSPAYSKINLLQSFVKEITGITPVIRISDNASSSNNIGLPNSGSINK